MIISRYIADSGKLHKSMVAQKYGIYGSTMVCNTLWYHCIEIHCIEIHRKEGIR